MTNLCDRVKCRICADYLSKKCSKNSCSVKLKDAPDPHLLIDVDKMPKGGNTKRCDYIFIGCGDKNDKNWVVAIELKKGQAQASQVLAQLRAGAELADRIIPEDASVQFLPVVASNNIHSTQMGILKKKASRVKFRQGSVFVERIRCRCTLASVLK